MISRQNTVLLNEGLLDQLPVIPISSRCCLAFYSSCRTISRSIVKSVVQTLVDYTPDDESIDQESLTNSMMISDLVQGANEVATAMLRSFCNVTAHEYSKRFIDEVINASDLEGVASVSCAIVRDLITCIRDCNEVVCDSPSPLPTPAITLFSQLTRMKPGTEENEMMNYIEKAISSRMRILPVELKSTMKEVIGSVLKVFAKEVCEEIRANVCYDYQLQNVVVNMGFIMTMVGELVKDDTDVMTLMEEVVYSTYDRCYEPSSMDETKQREMVENGIELYKDSITVEEY